MSCSSRRRSHAVSALRRIRTPPPGSRTAAGPAPALRQRQNAARDTRSSAVTSSIVSSGSSGATGSSSGVAGGRPEAVGVPGGGPSADPGRRTLRSGRRVKSGPRRAADRSPQPGAAGPGNGDNRSGPAGELPGGAVHDTPGPAGGEGRQERARGPGRWPAARPRRCRRQRRPTLPPGGGTGWPAARDRRHPPSTPPAASSRPGPVCPAGQAPGAQPHAGKGWSPAWRSDIPGTGRGRVPRGGHGGARRAGAGHRRMCAWCRAGRCGHARPRTARDAAARDLS
jgi:hypothetical protein